MSDMSMPQSADTDNAIAWTLLRAIWHAAGGHGSAIDRVGIAGAGSLPSVFAVSDLAAAAVGAAGLALSELMAMPGAAAPHLTVDRRLASLWFGFSLKPDGWTLPSPWDAIAGDYRTRDGWIKLHTNAPHHRAAALAVLGVAADKDVVRRAVELWDAETLETAIVEAGGCAAKLRSAEEWRKHPQGLGLAGECLIDRIPLDTGTELVLQTAGSRPLSGLRVLDLTRVLAGPVATRFLAGYGADVLRIDPLDWDEEALSAEVMLGKRGARIDLRSQAGRSQLIALLATADVLVHGYRPDALERLGLGLEVRRATRPGLVEATLDAYGWTGPWAGRRGFDSLVQMSCGIAHAGMTITGADKPVPLPVQALDQATGYILATSVILGLLDRIKTGKGSLSRTSLAGVASLLMSVHPDLSNNTEISAPLGAITPPDFSDSVENTGWGPARRLRPPLVVAGEPMVWPRAARPLGSDTATWSG